MCYLEFIKLYNVSFQTLELTEHKVVAFVSMGGLCYTAPNRSHKHLGLLIGFTFEIINYPFLFELFLAPLCFAAYSFCESMTSTVETNFDS